MKTLIASLKESEQFFTDFFFLRHQFKSNGVLPNSTGISGKSLRNAGALGTSKHCILKATFS